MKKIILIVTGLTFLLLSCTHSEKQKPQKENNMKTHHDIIEGKYSQSVEVPIGDSKMLFISGQIAFNENGELVGKGDIVSQTHQVFKNIEKQLKNVNADFKDIVKLDVMLTDMNLLAQFIEVRKNYIDPKKPPASTVVGVNSLVNTELLIEIDAIAIVKVPNKK